MTINGRVITPDSRLSQFSGDSNILELSTTKRVSASGPVTAVYDWENMEEVEAIVDLALQKIGSSEEPTSVLREYRKTFLQGRPLDLSSDETPIEGDTRLLFIGRMSLWEDLVSEFESIENIRDPLEIKFYGEVSADYGGPRKEFLRLALDEIKERIINHEDGIYSLFQKTDLIATHGYYYAGMVVGMSALQNGPCADFLDNLVSNWHDKEHYTMFKKGLERVGLWQLLEKKPSVKYLFRRRIAKVTVTKLLYLIQTPFHEEGSNRRKLEERTYSAFRQYLREVAAGRKGSMTLEKIMQFITGSAEEPVLGFEMRPFF
ncbi:uncharacterized protein LOC110442634 [Mizuhopecten yessoensis]|uniref:HECT domain-containing protein n=1 Tax=Mizuhopecten yessoensis TaxID=6573 RepID=A0A210R0T7_MIZYE|nr:uncharacterized protein LOC110442634 [Mizuhopecten yessoensis]OWF54628.1 hypothetical protein KP79_PYT00316 [Mizuhopecten yessoensis]